jgi:hypothetical protein
MKLVDSLKSQERLLGLRKQVGLLKKLESRLESSLVQTLELTQVRIPE